MGKFKVTGGLSHWRAFGSTGPAQVGMQLTFDKPRKGLIMKTKSRNLYASVFVDKDSG